jgi:tetratricopeptide (TPR) repeat protein
VAVDVERGWTAFEAGQLVAAEAAFQSALAKNARLPEAHSGAGWSRALQGRLEEAAASFESAILYDDGYADAHAGLAAVSLALRDRAAAITHARAALAADTDWSFSHQAGIDHEDLRLIVAQAAAIGSGAASLADAQAELDLLDPQNGLEPGQPSSWVVEGATYASYQEALLAAIEVVERRVGAAIR